jgi:DNA-binding NarL/FixJ family response regulator
MDKIRILIADDHPVFRFGLRALIDADSGMEVVGEVATGSDAIQQAAALQPDVVLMDLKMSDVNGVEATRRIVQVSPHIGILVITMFEDDSVFAAMQAGALGYLVKGAAPEETLRAIRVVAGGEAVFSPSIAERAMQYFARQPHSNANTDVLPELTDREREVLALIAKGYTNTSIAEQLSLSPKTVRNHISNVFSKLQVADRTQAILRAREAGLSRSQY